MTVSTLNPIAEEGERGRGWRQRGGGREAEGGRKGERDGVKKRGGGGGGWDWRSKE